ncbi:MAG: ATP-binding protein [Ghiorsea sp.]
MRLYGKIFFLLVLTLLVTAGLSSWLSQKWMGENQAIELRLNALASLGETAVRLYVLKGEAAYHQWQRQTSRIQHFQGVLIDADASQTLNHPAHRHFLSLLEQVKQAQKKTTIIDPPRLAVGLPLAFQGHQYYWLADTRLPPEVMQQGGRQMLQIRVGMALLVILLISGLITRMLTRPIRQLQESSKQLADGDLSARSATSVSERKDELGDLGRSFDQMAESLAGLVNHHKQLLRDISHELRSPLARLQVALELARNEAGDKAGDELDRIGLEAERLNALIGEVLTLARFEQGAVQAENKSLLLHEIVKALLVDAAFEAEYAGKQVIPLEIESCQVFGDPLWLSRALENIIRNAISHTKEHGDVEVSLQCQEGYAVIIVRDYGEGVDEKLLSDLFEPFFRVSEARERHNTNQASGYGLGLAIARRAIELQGGEINAHNHSQVGFEVMVKLPLM